MTICNQFRIRRLDTRRHRARDHWTRHRPLSTYWRSFGPKPLSPAFFEILTSKCIGITTSTFQGHVTSSVTLPGIGWDRNACVSVLFHDVEPYICYLLIRYSYFYVLFVVQCTLHSSRVASLNVLSLSFQKSQRLSRFCQNIENVYHVCRAVYR